VLLLGVGRVFKHNISLSLKALGVIIPWKGSHKLSVLHSLSIVKDTLKSFQPRLHSALWVSFGLLVYPCPTCAKLHLPVTLNYHMQGIDKVSSEYIWHKNSPERFCF
jgi:hypothetical protein